MDLSDHNARYIAERYFSSVTILPNKSAHLIMPINDNIYQAQIPDLPPFSMCRKSPTRSISTWFIRIRRKDITMSFEDTCEGYSLKPRFIRIEVHPMRRAQFHPTEIDVIDQNKIFIPVGGCSDQFLPIGDGGDFVGVCGRARAAGIGPRTGNRRECKKCAKNHPAVGKPLLWESNITPLLPYSRDFR